MPKFEFYRANASYFRKIFYYRYIGIIKIFFKFLLLPGLVILFIIDRFVFPHSDFFNDLALKLAITAAITAIGIIVGFLGLLVLKHTYITIYSLRKELEEVPMDIRLSRRLFFLDLPFKIIIGALLVLVLLFIIVSLVLHYKFGIHFLFLT